jgi:Zn-dependent protease
MGYPRPGDGAIIRQMDQSAVSEGLLWFLAFLFSTTLHEAAHAWAALRGGDPTAYHGGQVSVSPIPHIRREPIGMVVVPLLTTLTQGWALGWASTPIDARWAERHPRRAALMSAAGPAANFLLALLAWTALRIGLALDYFEAPDTFYYAHLVVQVTGGPKSVAALLAQALSVMLMLNVLLGTFNLLPLPPLDGASAISLLLPDDLAGRFRAATRSPMFSMVGLLVAWQVFPAISGPLFRLVIRTLHPGAI